MATYMEKDVLLEYASIGYLLPDEETEEMKEDSKTMGKLWHRIMKSEPQDINYQETLKEIKAIKDKYAGS